MKIVATISNYGAAANIGGHVEYRSAIIEIPDNQIPKIVREYMEGGKWSSLSFSILEAHDE